MAENQTAPGGPNDNNSTLISGQRRRRRSTNGNQTKLETVVTPSSSPTPATFTDAHFDITQIDSVHRRLRPHDEHKAYICLSCDQIFQASSILEVYEHYGEQEHINFYANCLYCHGKVHRYCDVNNNRRIEVYHSCVRSKRRDDC